MEMERQGITVSRHIPNNERLRRLGMHSLNSCRLFSSGLNLNRLVDSRGHLFKVLQDTSRHFLNYSLASVKVVKYWNRHPISLVTTRSKGNYIRRGIISFQMSCDLLTGYIHLISTRFSATSIYTIINVS